MGKSVVGVDIGSTTLRAVEVMDAGKSRPTVTRYHEVLLPEGSVSRGEVLEPNTVASALKQLWAEGGFKSKDVVLGMGNQRVLARDLTVPKMSLARIRESLPYLVQDMLPVPVADALLDFYPISESMSETGPVVNGLLVAAIKDAVSGNVKAVQLAGLATADVDLIPFALSRLLITRPRLTQTVVLIDIGANTTSIVLATHGVPQFVRIIPTGGADLTQALRSGLEIEAAQADELKRRLGLASQVATQEEARAVEIIYSVTSDLLSSVRNTINYFVNTRPNELVSRIVITGGAAQLPGLANALAEMTRLPVEAGNPFASVSVAKSVNSEHLRQSQSAIGVALGLALGSAAA